METYEWIVMVVVLTLFAGYVTASIVLLKYPSLLHKKKRNYFQCRHISHRGGAAENLENTMTAFRHAVNLKTEMLELDCHLTKDKQVVVCHDDGLKRISGHDSLVSDHNYEDLPLIKEILLLQFNSSVSVEGSSEDRRIPLLRDVFEEFPNIPINLDVKCDNDDLIEKIHGLIVEYKRQKLMAWGSRHGTVTDKLHKLDPSIGLISSIGSVVKIIILFYVGLLPFIPIKEDFFEVLMPSILIDNKKLYNSLSLGIRILLKTIDFLLMSKILFRHLNRRGIHTYLWVLNDEEQFDRAFEHEVEGIMTDYPSKLRHYLDTRDTGSNVVDYGTIDLTQEN